MKTIRYILIILLLFATEFIMAQPLPPSNPNGSPVPAGNALWILLMGVVGFAYSKSNIKTLIVDYFRNKFNND